MQKKASKEQRQIYVAHNQPRLDKLPDAYPYTIEVDAVVESESSLSATAAGGDVDAPPPEHHAQVSI